MKIIPKLTLPWILLIIIILFLGVCYWQGLEVADDDDSIPDIIGKGFGKITATLVPSDDDDDTDDPPETDPHWEESGTASEWSFTGAGDFNEWSLSFGEGYTSGRHKIEISRRWNFKDTFTCGEGSVVWCLHDSNNNQIWHKEDSATILNYVTDTTTSGTYNGTPWRFFIGNNYACDIDPHWRVTIYTWVE